MSVAIALADDSVIAREGVARILAGDPDIEVVATCEDLPSLLDAVESAHPDVVVTDIRMPPTGTDEGIRLAALLREQHPDIGVVVLSNYAEPAYALALLESGSEGRAYLLKERVHDRAQLVAAIESVAAGGSVLDSKIVEPLVAAKLRVERSPLAGLTAREREVLAEVAKGKSNAAIADTLVLTKRAVEKHINSIFLKLNLSHAEDVSKRVKATLLFLANPDSVVSRVTDPGRARRGPSRAGLTRTVVSPARNGELPERL
jgi:DNA-binding NarL/FixJ family response regulator